MWSATEIDTVTEEETETEKETDRETETETQSLFSSMSSITETTIAKTDRLKDEDDFFKTTRLCYCYFGYA